MYVISVHGRIGISAGISTSRSIGMGKVPVWTARNITTFARRRRSTQGVMRTKLVQGRAEG
jgi:hypothetical protein